MNTNRIMVLVLLLFIQNLANAGNMAEIYEFVINDCYKQQIMYNVLSEKDTMYFACNDCDYCENPGECFDYKIELKNDKIKLGVPIVDENVHAALYFRLSSPELDKQLVTVCIVKWSIEYESEKRINLIRYGSILYTFKYSKRKSKYVFDSKKEYDL